MEIQIIFNLPILIETRNRFLSSFLTDNNNCSDFFSGSNFGREIWFLITLCIISSVLITTLKFVLFHFAYSLSCPKLQQQSCILTPSFSNLKFHDFFHLYLLFKRWLHIFYSKIIDILWLGWYLRTFQYSIHQMGLALSPRESGVCIYHSQHLCACDCAFHSQVNESICLHPDVHCQLSFERLQLS